MKKRVVLFVALTFALTWGLVFWLMLTKTPYGSVLCMSVFSLCMLLPALCSILTRLITREGFSQLYLAPHFKGHWRYYLAGLLGPSVLIAAGAAVYFLLFPRQFDPQMTALSQTLAAQGAADVPVGTLLAGQILFGALFGGIVNLPFALGEELGWRGYLFPHLCQDMSPNRAIVVSGVIWGLWHAPMIAMGHNYGVDYPTAPWGGIGAMVVFCIAVGAFLSYLTVRTQSALPAALGHGALNALAAAPVYFMHPESYNPFLGPVPMGLIGGVGFLAAAAFCMIRLAKTPPVQKPDGQ